VQAVGQGGPVRDAASGGVGFLFDLAVGNHAGDEALGLGLLGSEDPPLQKNLQGRCPAHQIDQSPDFRVGHGDGDPIDRHSVSAGYPADPEVAHGRQLQTPADAYTLDHCDNRMLAVPDGLHGFLDQGSVSPCLLAIRAVRREFGDIGTRREGLFAGSAQDNAAQRLIRGKLLHRLSHPQPQLPAERVQLVRAVENNRCDVFFPPGQENVAHWIQVSPEIGSRN